MRRKIIVMAMVIFTILLSSFFFFGYQLLYSPNFLINRDPDVVLIPKEATFKSVQDSLYNRDIVHNLVYFSFLARLMKFDRQVKPGLYEIGSGMSNIEVIRLLRSGAQVPTYVTFNNVRLKEDLAGKITQNVDVTPGEFLGAMETFAGNQENGFSSENIMAMFIPNTYEVYWTVTADELVGRMKYEYDLFWDESRLSKAEDLGLTPVEVSILASIVQAESIKPEESPVIAGLYMNRLNKRYRLQADPTLVYAVGDFTLKRVLNIHKEVESPYNTYKYYGLPPGPINLPSIQSIDAVLNHEKHNYLYMCAREDFSGFHRFATNLQEHNINAARYQRALSAEQRKARLQNSNR